MSRILAFLLVVCAATTLALPIDDRQADEDVLRVRLVRSANPGYGHHGYHGHHGGYDGGFGGYGGYGGPSGFSGGNTFAQSSANAASINTPFGTASFASSSANSGAQGR